MSSIVAEADIIYRAQLIISANQHSLNNKTEVTSIKLVLFKYVMSFETLSKVDQLADGGGGGIYQL